MITFLAGLVLILFLYLLFSAAVIKHRHHKYDGVLIWQYFIDGIIIGICQLLGLSFLVLTFVGYFLVKGCSSVGLFVIRWVIAIKKFLMGF